MKIKKSFTKYKVSEDSREHNLKLSTTNIEAAKYEIRKTLKVRRLPETLIIY